MDKSRVRTLLSLLAATFCLVGLPAMLASCDLFADEEEQQIPKVEIHTVKMTDSVFVCMGKSAVRFHSTDSCPGLTNCSKGITLVTRGDAEAKKKDFCHICFRDSVNGE